jgi:Flp pilus assembly protein TadG
MSRFTKQVVIRHAHGQPRPMRVRYPRTQRGVTAIEFALVFPLFFAILYAIVTFSLILVAQQNLTLAASEGARAALNWQANAGMQDALAKRAAAACTAAQQVTATLVQAMQCTSTSAACGSGMECVNVQLTFNYSLHPIVPTLPLLSYAVPTMLTSSATVQLNPENIQ